MRQLFLHIGHSKTGSSYIQSCLANSVEALHANGIDYHHGAGGRAAGWQISSGNGQALIQQPVDAFQFEQGKILFSAEQFFRAFTQDGEFAAKLGRFCARHEIASVSLLLLIRDPIRHAESSHQQMIKRGGSTADVATVFDRYRMPEMVRDLLCSQMDLPDLRIDVFNYDRHKTNLTGLVARFLGLPDGVLQDGGSRTVNRSMTAAELALQAAVNAELGASGRFLSDALCNSAPDVPAGRYFPPLEVQQRMLDRLRPAIEAVNAVVAPEERYRLELQEPADQPAQACFSPHQIGVIGSAIGTHVARLHNQLTLERLRRQSVAAELMLLKGDGTEAGLLANRVIDQIDLLKQTDADSETLSRLRQKAVRLRRAAK